MRLLKIGRDASCDIVLHSAAVSSLHAELTILNNGDILLEDKNSRNGTFVMNKVVRPGVSIPLRRGDMVRFADVELRWDQVPQPEDTSAYKAILGIGSNFRNEIQVAGNTVSRYHATLKIDKSGKAFLEDHSKNGTTINGLRLSNGQTMRVKRGDVVRCGGVEVNLRPYLPASVLPMLFKTAGVAIFLVLAALLVKYLITPTTSPSDYIQSTVYIHAYYHYEARIVDDPFISVLKSTDFKYPSVYNYGVDEKGALGIMDKTSTYSPIGYSGTGFFVSTDGKIMTNRHVAIPWEGALEEHRDVISQHMAQVKNEVLPYLINALAQYNNIDEKTLNAWITRYQTSPVEITGAIDYIAVGYANHKYNSIDEFERCTVIANSDGPEIDLAMLQLNSNETPAKIVNIIDLNRIVDDKKIRPQKETYYYIGYPLGLNLNLDNMNGGLQPRMNEVRISKIAGRYELDLQGEVFGGASGSPIITEDGRLVGVINKSIRQTEMSRGVLAKYAKQMFDEYN